jgi:AcrR family transcriptional regulator
MEDRCVSGGYARHHEQQRQNILLAAENLALEKGIDALTMKDVAEESGVTRATLYRFFKTKDEILWAINRVLSREIGAMLSGFTGSTYRGVV